MRLFLKITACFFIFSLLISGCAPMNKDEKKQISVVGAGAGMGGLIGQLLFASTPGTLIPAVIGAGTTAVYLKVTKKDEIIIVEESPEPIDDSYYVLPVDSRIPKTIESCRETTLTIEKNFEKQVLPIKVCRDQNNRLLINAI